MKTVGRGEPRKSTGARSGFQLVELCAALSILGITLAFTVPTILNLSNGVRVRLAAWELVGVLRTARAQAVRRSARVGVKFRQNERGQVSFTMYQDGDGDGVLTRDIEGGIDPPIGMARTLEHMGHQVGFGFPPGPPPRDPGDPGRRLRGTDDPIRFNRSDLASFSPMGGSTPGSLYVTDHRGHLAVVRVFGFTGKVKMMIYDLRSETWD